MADFFRGVSNFFGLTPTDDDVDYDDRYDRYDSRAEDDYEDSYRDSRDSRADRTDRAERAGRSRYSLRDEDSHETAARDERDSRELDDHGVEEGRYGSLHSVEAPREPEHVFIKPESSFQDKYSKAPEIGKSFRDGDIVTFDLSELDPAEAKRYVDFVAGLVFGLRGRLKADGSVFTLYPHGCDVNERQYDRMSG